MLDGYSRSFASNQQMKDLYILVQNPVNVLLFKGLIFIVYVHSIARKLQYFAISGV